MASRWRASGSFVSLPRVMCLQPTGASERAPAVSGQRSACLAGERKYRWHGLRAQWTARRRRRRLGRARPGLGEGVGGRRRDGGDLQPGPRARGSGGGRGGRWVHPAGGGRRRRGGWRGVRRRPRSRRSAASTSSSPTPGGRRRGTSRRRRSTSYPAALDLNLMSVVGMVKAAVDPMRDRGWGRVVAITSLSVRQPMAELILSNTARAGATGFLKTVARELAGTGVTVNSVQPGLHRTARVTQLYGGDVAAHGGHRRPRRLRQHRRVRVQRAGEVPHRRSDPRRRRRVRGAPVAPAADPGRRPELVIDVDVTGCRRLVRVGPASTDAAARAVRSPRYRERR